MSGHLVTTPDCRRWEKPHFNERFSRCRPCNPQSNRDQSTFTPSGTNKHRAASSIGHVDGLSGRPKYLDAPKRFHYRRQRLVPLSTICGSSFLFADIFRRTCLVADTLACKKSSHLPSGLSASLARAIADAGAKIGLGVARSRQAGGASQGGWSERFPPGCRCLRRHRGR